MEQLFYPDGENPLNISEITQGYDVTIPVLDSEINIAEVEHIIQKQVKPNKSSGPDGVSPGLFRWLPVQWFLFLTVLLNMAFFLWIPCQVDVCNT